MELFTGSAPISAEVIDFFKIAFGCDVVEGMKYRLTLSAWLILI